MKMKRMEMRDVSIGEYQFKIRPFGAKDALYIFGDVEFPLILERKCRMRKPKKPLKKFNE